MLNIGHASVTENTNGPGRRFTVWVQGCSRNCPGCFNPGLRTLEERSLVSPDALAAEALHCGPLDGVSLSGGEPFDQAEGLFEFLAVLRSAPTCRKITALAFTGYCLEELQVGRAEWRQLLTRLDLLVDGPYREGEAVELPLRGSRNQRLLALSPAGAELRRQIENHPPAHFEATIAADGEVILTGFPPASALQRLRSSLGG